MEDEERKKKDDEEAKKQSMFKDYNDLVDATTNVSLLQRLPESLLLYHLFWIPNLFITLSERTALNLHEGRKRASVQHWQVYVFFGRERGQLEADLQHGGTQVHEHRSAQYRLAAHLRARRRQRQDHLDQI